MSHSHRPSTVHFWPAHDALSAEQTAAAMRGLLSMAGHDPGDFELHVDEESQLNALLGIHERLLSVRRRSTGDERLYSVGPHTPWLAELLADVEAGLYGVVATVVGRGGRP